MFGNADSATSLKSSIKVSLEYLMNCASEKKEDSNYIFHKEGLQLLSKSKAAIVLIISEEINNREAIETNGVSKSSLSNFEKVLLGCSMFRKVWYLILFSCIIWVSIVSSSLIHKFIINLHTSVLVVMLCNKVYASTYNINLLWPTHFKCRFKVV